MNVLVMGATGGSGQAAVTSLLERGHTVTAFVRREGAPRDGLLYFVGDAMNARDVEAAVTGHDAVVVALGISENALAVRLFGPARTPIDIRSEGTRNVIAAMKKHGVRRLVVQTSYGVGPTRDRLGVIDGLFFTLVLEPQIADTEAQTDLVEQSGLDFVLVQPVHLVDDADDAMPFVAVDGATERMKVTRRSVGRLLAEAVTNPAWSGQTLAVSGKNQGRVTRAGSTLVPASDGKIQSL